MEAATTWKLENRLNNFPASSFDTTLNIHKVKGIEDHQRPACCHGSAGVESALHMAV